MSQTLLTIFSFFWVNVTPYFHVWTAFFETVTQWFFISYKPSYCFAFSYITLFFEWTGRPFYLFFCVELFHFSCLNVTKIPCVSSPLSLCKCHTCTSPFSLCECHMNILISPLLLSGHSTFFLFWS